MYRAFIYGFFAIVQALSVTATDMPQIKDLLLLTVATEENDGFKRYLRSTQVYGLRGKVVGMNEEWKGGDMKYPGGAYKINLLKKEMEEYKNKDDLVVMFTDSYDVILLAQQEKIIAKFLEFEARVVFGTENSCWPDVSLENDYPVMDDKGKRFLNSGGFIGYANDVYDILVHQEVNDEDDDQLYYTRIFLDPEMRAKHQIKLDHKSEIFQNLNGAISEVVLNFRDDAPYLKNNEYDTEPLVLHGNGPESTKINFNTLSNYLPKAWNPERQCTSCLEDTITFDKLVEQPQVLLAIFIVKPTAFIEEFFDKITKLDYPKDKIDLFVYNSDPFHANDVRKFTESCSSNEMYHSVEVVDYVNEDGGERGARQDGIQHCADIKCDFYFSVDGETHLENAQTLKLLIEQNRDMISPMVVRPYKPWSNFWGAISENGYYGRSQDYMSIVGGNRTGLWNVPYVSSVYLLKGSLIHESKTELNFAYQELDPDMAFCANLRKQGIFMYTTNRAYWGHLVFSDDFHNPNHLHNELWTIESNPYDWEARYLHPNYHDILEERVEATQPCPDVYWFPIFTERFADEFVAELEHYGKWSSGSNEDNRLDGGYENVPTRDIHMNQIDYQNEWLYILNKYVRPLQEKVFFGYYSDPQPNAIMMFAVRYKPDEQPSLRPHQDSSTYTINIALNHVGIDYEGGGCHFLRYNCSVTNTKKGWMLMHPGRLTHHHEGLLVTRGTRYIMVTFVDP